MILVFEAQNRNETGGAKVYQVIPSSTKQPSEWEIFYQVSVNRFLRSCQMCPEVRKKIRLKISVRNLILALNLEFKLLGIV